MGGLCCRGSATIYGGIEQYHASLLNGQACSNTKSASDHLPPHPPNHHQHMQPQTAIVDQQSKLTIFFPVYTLNTTSKSPKPYQHVALVNSVDRKLIKK